MKITVLTLFPNLINEFLNTSIIKRSIQKEVVDIKVVDIRDYSIDKHRHVDDTPYGGGAGMLIRSDVIIPCLKANKTDKSYVLLTSPKARPYSQNKAIELSKKEDIVIICGHYEGIDARVEKYVDENISIGDYILTGGEIPCMAIIDSITRLLDESISSSSLKEESYNNGLLEYKQYTKPAIYDNDEVPSVLVNGNHKLIREFNLKSSLEETLKYRPELIDKSKLDEEELNILKDLENNHK